MSSSGARLRWLTRALALAALVAGAIAARVVYSAQHELRTGDAALARGETDDAIAHYRRAARFYAPGSPYHVRALDALAKLARAAEDAGEADRALAAYRAIRGSILSTRSLYVPETERLRAADARIAGLMAELPAPGMDAGKSKEQLRAEHLALLTAAPDPNLFWTVVLLAGFGLWVLAAFVFSHRAIDEQDRYVAREARRWGAMIVIGFGMFALGLVLA